MRPDLQVVGTTAHRWALYGMQGESAMESHPENAGGTFSKLAFLYAGFSGKVHCMQKSFQPRQYAQKNRHLAGFLDVVFISPESLH
ncbi:MAG: hypothetical protein KDI30_10130 [Pseudomonadales bacterium]|nr:hypothetical protein [Pseudomonadales bacterium]